MGHAPTSPIRVAHEPDLPPLAWRDEGWSRGWVVELVAAALAEAGLGFTFVPRLGRLLEAELHGGEVDAVAGLGIVPERRERLAFSTPLLTTGGAWFLPTVADGDTPADGARVTTPGSGPLQAAIAKTRPDLEVILASSYRDALSAVAHGFAGAAALGLHAGAHLARRDGFEEAIRIPDSPFLPIEVGLACRPDAEGRALIAAFDAGLASIRAAGTADEIRRRHTSP